MGFVRIKKRKPAMKHEHTAPSNNMADSGVIDPVCGMAVDPATARHKAAHQGHDYYFCSAGCKAKFQADPAKYLEASAKSS